MKKLFAILLIVLAVTPLFASEGQIGATLGFQNFWIKDSDGATNLSIVASVDGANYFGNNGGFGVEYGIGMIDLMSYREDNHTVDDDDFDPSLLLHAGASYRYGFTDVIGISAGLGLASQMTWDSMTIINSQIDIFDFTMALYGRVAADFTFSSLRLNLGLEMGGPIYSMSKVSGEGYSKTTDDIINGFYLTPYVSLSYKY